MHVEFLIVLFPVLLTFLFLVQLSHAFMAKLAVQHAANAAARSAIVVLAEEQDDPGRIPLNDELNAFVPGAGPAGSDGAMRSIENAAAMRLLAIAPPLSSVSSAQRDVRTALGAADGSFLTGSAQYARRAIQVNVNPRNPSPGDTVEVAVVYYFDCAVPTGDVWVCDSGPPPGVASSHRFIRMEARARLPFQGRVRGGE